MYDSQEEIAARQRTGLIALVIALGLVVLIGLALLAWTRPGSIALAWPRSKGAVYQGQTAQQWAPGLFDRDESIVRASAYALYRIRDDGLPYLVKGLASDQVATRIWSAQMLTSYEKHELAPFTDALVPAAKRMMDRPAWVEERELGDRVLVRLGKR